MPTVRGRSAVKRFIEQLPEQIEKKVLRGAARAAADVIADEARQRAVAKETRDAVVTKARAEPGHVTVKITVKPGWGRSLGFWAEYGTAPHFISVDDGQRQGMTVRRINDKAKDGVLVIGGAFVGRTVHHPGVDPHPWLRTSLDVKEDEAIAAARRYVASHIGPAGVIGTADASGDEG